MDFLLRKTGAKVRTYGSSGSSPSWWIEGNITKSGFYSKNEKGITYDPVNWKTPHDTPILEKVLDEFKPNIILVSLGANLLRRKEEVIQKEVKDLCEIIKKRNIRIIWIGPPNGRPDKKKPEEQDFLYKNLMDSTKEYADFIDSRPYTSYPDSIKGDGVHFFGKVGKEISKQWAGKVFNQIQNLKP